MSESSADRISAIASKMLLKRGGKPDPSPEQNLRECGLTSLDMVNFMLAIEAEFDVEIAQGDMTPENFDTIAAVTALLASMRKAA